MVLEATGRSVDASDDFGEELAVEIGQENPDRHRAPSYQGAGRTVGDVPQRLSGCEHTLTCRLPDRPVAVECAGNGPDRHARLASHVLDRRAQTLPQGQRPVETFP